MGFRLRILIQILKPKIGWESRKKIEKELILLREKIRLQNKFENF